MSTTDYSTAGEMPGEGELLGSATFKDRYHTTYAYAAGAMYRGISSVEMVQAFARANMLSFFGTGGLSVEKWSAAFETLSTTLANRSFGVNFFHQPGNPQAETTLLRLIEQYDIPFIEASAFTRPAKNLVALKAGALYRDGGEIRCRRQLLVKLSRPDVAAAFLDPPAPEILEELVNEGTITRQQAVWAASQPVASDIMVEADSGGHTDNGIPHIILESILFEREKRKHAFANAPRVHIGLGGGIGSPAGVAMGFMLGADFIFTGSINQCTPEAGTAAVVKDLLQTVNTHHTTMAASGNLFEMGARIQVVKKNTLFPARANMLYNLYQTCNSLNDIPAAVRDQLEKKFFNDSLDKIWAETAAYQQAKYPQQWAAIQRSEKQKMALLFRNYFFRSNEWTVMGNPEQQMNYQVHCGPAMGLFNNWVTGTPLENWRNRNCAVIGRRLMDAGATLLAEKANHWKFLNESKKLV